MKKIGFVTTNKVMAQSLAATVRSNPDLGIELFLLLNPKQAALDAEVLELDAAVVDVSDTALEGSCDMLRQAVPGCRLLLLVPKTGHGMAIKAMKTHAAADFVFYDTSLEYLFAKLAAI